MTNKEWPDDEIRIDLIGRNGSTAEHYMKIKLLAENAKAPVRATEHAAGYDIFCNEHISLIPGARALIGTGFAMAIPHGFCAKITPRSGLAVNYGIDVLAGLIDSDFIGEIKVLLINHGESSVTFNRGDRIAQMVIHSVYQEETITTPSLEPTSRGVRGFGSTGV